ncbi:YndJ family transporter [Planctomycetota bacterium]|nr:YndJ family transporter [Planctomycetota bacterium]
MLPSPGMNPKSSWLRLSAVGACAWLVFAVLRSTSTDLDGIDRVLLFHVLCLTPLLLGAAGRSGPRWAVLPAALLVAISSLIAPGVGAALLGVPWLLVAGWVFVGSLRRVRLSDVESGALAVAHLFWLVGAGWILLSRARVQLPGLDDGKILLAAVHGHFVGFGALTLVACAARTVRGWKAGAERKLIAVIAGVGVGFAVTGVGIAFAAPLELVGAIILWLSLGAFAVYQLLVVAPNTRSWPAVLLTLSSLSVLGALLLGLLFSSRVLGAPAVPLVREQMVLFHGWVVAVGFVLCGLAGHWLVGRQARRVPEDPILLYDGACGLCAHSVQTILRMDRVHQLRFAALQGDSAGPILERHTRLTAPGFDSLVLVSAPGTEHEQVHSHYAAILEILPTLGTRWAALGRVGRLIPNWLGDAGYRLVAANRHRLFAPPDACMVPAPEVRKRFLA